MSQLSPLQLPSSIDYLLRPGRLHLVDANAQQLIWLALEHNLEYSCVVLSTVGQIADVVGRDFNNLHLVICDTSAMSRVSFPIGYQVDVGFNTIAIVLGKGLNSAADYQTIHAVDLSQFNGDYFTAIKEAYAGADAATRDIYMKLYREYPTALYQKLRLPTTEMAIDWDDEDNNLTTGIFNTMLAALTDTKSIQSYWIDIDKPTAMRLFGNSQLFINWLSKDEDQGKCRALAPLLLPFVRAFNQTKNVEYIKAFGRWCLYSRTRWSNKFSLGVSPYLKSYYCSFSGQALHRWREIVTQLEQTLP